MKTRALVFTGVGAAEVSEREVAPLQPQEVLIETQVNGICAFELHAFTGELPIDWFPAIMGHEAVGRVVDIGAEVRAFKTGDLVTALGFNNYCDYFPLWEGQVARIPDDRQDPAHWLGEPPACAVNAIRLLEERNPGRRMTIIGCGFMGLLLVQLAVKRGFEVSACDLNSERCRLAAAYGAATTAPDPGSQDVVIECSGSAKAMPDAENLLRNGGVLCLFAHHLPTRVCNTNLWHMKGLDILNATPMASRDWNRDFHDAVQYLRDGVFDLSRLITHVYDAAEPQAALENITRLRPDNYIKGVFRFCA